MIIRIMSEGQLAVDDSMTRELNVLDGELDAALKEGDEAAFRSALGALLAKVRAVGAPLPADTLHSSDLILPPADATMREVRDLMNEDGLIPG